MFIVRCNRFFLKTFQVKGLSKWDNRGIFDYSTLRGSPDLGEPVVVEDGDLPDEPGLERVRDVSTGSPVDLVSRELPVAPRR